MKDQVETIKKQLMDALRAEIAVLEKTMNQTEIAKKAGVYQQLISSLKNMNEKSFKTLAVQKLISMANRLGLDVELIIKKRSK